MLFPTYKIDEDFAHGRNTGDLVSIRIPKLFGFEKSGYSRIFDLSIRPERRTLHPSFPSPAAVRFEYRTSSGVAKPSQRSGSSHPIQDSINGHISSSHSPTILSRLGFV